MKSNGGGGGTAPAVNATGPPFQYPAADMWLQQLPVNATGPPSQYPAADMWLQRLPVNAAGPPFQYQAANMAAATASMTEEANWRRLFVLHWITKLSLLSICELLQHTHCPSWAFSALDLSSAMSPRQNSHQQLTIGFQHGMWIATSTGPDKSCSSCQGGA